MNYIQVNGDPIERVALDYRKPARSGTGLSYYYGRGNRTRLVNGVHRGADLEPDHLGNEASVRPLEGELAGGTLWERHVSGEDMIDLKNYFLAQYGEYQTNVVAYAFTYVRSARAQDGYLWLGSDDGIRVWLNGELVWDDPSTGSYRLVEDKVPIHLRAGVNALLVKVKNESGSYAFSLAAMEEDGDTLPGIEYLIQEPVTAVLSAGAENATPRTLSLAQNYPNPFNSQTVIRFTAPNAPQAELTVYDLAGQQVATLWRGACPPGEHAFRWDGRDDRGRRLASGTYLYRLRAGGQTETRKLLLVR
jgi:hypothetical protein